MVIESLVIILYVCLPYIMECPTMHWKKSFIVIQNSLLFTPLSVRRIPVGKQSYELTIRIRKCRRRKDLKSRQESNVQYTWTSSDKIWVNSFHGNERHKPTCTPLHSQSLSIIYHRFSKNYYYTLTFLQYTTMISSAFLLYWSSLNFHPHPTKNRDKYNGQNGGTTTWVRFSSSLPLPFVVLKIKNKPFSSLKLLSSKLPVVLHQKPGWLT